MNPAPEPTTASESGQLLRYLDEALRRAGVDADAVLARVGLSRSALQRETLRTPVMARPAYFAAVQAVSGTAHPGLLLAAHVAPPTRFLPTYLLLSSATLREGMARVTRCLRLVSDALDGSLVEHADEAAFVIESGPGPHDGGHGELLLARGIQLVLQRVTGGAFITRRLHLRPAQTPAHHGCAALFGCPVHFHQPHSALVFSQHLLDLPSPFPDPQLAALHTAAAEAALLALDQGDVVRALRRVFAQSLEQGRPTLTATAAQLGLSERQLRLRLSSAGVGFEPLLDDFRRTLAQRLLREGESSLSQIAWLCGFSEQSAFQRAFKRWTGLSPLQWRSTQPAA